MSSYLSEEVLEYYRIDSKLRRDAKKKGMQILTRLYCIDPKIYVCRDIGRRQSRHDLQDTLLFAATSYSEAIEYVRTGKNPKSEYDHEAVMAQAAKEAMERHFGRIRRRAKKVGLTVSRGLGFDSVITICANGRILFESYDTRSAIAFFEDYERLSKMSGTK